MACSSGGCSTTGGCGSGGCGSGSCTRLNVFDWLSNMHDVIPVAQKTDLVEVRFKGGRKEIFRNNSNLELFTGDPIVVEVTGGHHVGFVSMQGELVKLQMKKKNIAEDENIKSIYRVATDKDLEKYEASKQRELSTMYRCREIIQQRNLQMKLSDIEYQADNTKATFFYSADERVDFRELIKILASEFKVRVEMKQISLRQEAGRLGGIGVCGRELCCSTWLTDFKSVSTTAARYQNLSLNPAKLSGQCGRLKCCLNYELDTYMDALKDIPTIEEALVTTKGEAYLQKTDIFRKIMWFAYKNETAWYPLSIEQVLKVVELNKQGIQPDSLSLDELESDREEELRGSNDDLERLDQKYSSKNSRNKKKKKKPQGGDTATQFTVNNKAQNQPSRENIPARENQHPNRNNNNQPNNQQNNQKPRRENFVPKQEPEKKVTLDTPVEDIIIERKPLKEFFSKRENQNPTQNREQGNQRPKNIPNREPQQVKRDNPVQNEPVRNKEVNEKPAQENFPPRKFERVKPADNEINNANTEPKSNTESEKSTLPSGIPKRVKQ